MKTWTKKFQKMLTLILAICLVTGCMGFSNVQAATGKSGTTYYDTCINGKKGGTITTNGTKYYMSGTRKAICKGNTLTMYASFNTSKNGILNSQNKKAYIKYGKHTFKLTSKTKYYFSGGEAPNDYCSKSAFMSTMRSMNGLGLRIKVTMEKLLRCLSIHDTTKAAKLEIPTLRLLFNLSLFFPKPFFFLCSHNPSLRRFSSHQALFISQTNICNIKAGDSLH